MKKLKLNFQHLGNAEVLTRSQLKKIMGGDEGSGQGCCAHVEGWTGGFQCGYPNAAAAEAAASTAAIQNGVRTFYCCQCAGSPGYPY